MQQPARRRRWNPAPGTYFYRHVGRGSSRSQAPITPPSPAPINDDPGTLDTPPPFTSFMETSYIGPLDPVDDRF